jgi:hypothetical protein
MAVKYFCDRCGKETTENQDRITVAQGTLWGGHAQPDGQEHRVYRDFCQPCGELVYKTLSDLLIEPREIQPKYQGPERRKQQTWGWLKRVNFGNDRRERGSPHHYPAPGIWMGQERRNREQAVWLVDGQAVDSPERREKAHQYRQEVLDARD